VQLLLSPEKIPLKEEFRFLRSENGLGEALIQIEVDKENLYCVLPPGTCFLNRMTLPFVERQKIETVIQYEVREYLPDPEGEYLTDFYNTGNEVYTFSAEKQVVGALLEEIGPYRNNLRSVIPHEVALMYAMQALVDEESYVLVDIGQGLVYIQFFDGVGIRTGTAIGISPPPNVKSMDGQTSAKPWMAAADGKSMDAQTSAEAGMAAADEESMDAQTSAEAGMAADDETLKDLRSRLIMVLKAAQPNFVYLNVRHGGQPAATAIKEMLDEFEVSYQEVPHHRFAHEMQSSGETGGVGEAGGADALTLFGALQGANRQPTERINLLKGEFKPRMKSYVSVRDFSIVGILLLVLLFLATAGLVLDIQGGKRQTNLLSEHVRTLNTEVYGDPSMTMDQAKNLVGQIEDQLRAVEANTDHNFSSLRLLRELSLYIPGDVIIEYSDIIIEREFIKFSGKARTFSDIDRIRQELLLSEYFSDVRVANTGTTGSTEGFTVTFVFDIDVVEEMDFGN
jgi:hypothetical protein